MSLRVWINTGFFPVHRTSAITLPFSKCRFGVPNCISYTLGVANTLLGAPDIER
jgi:hypothetical protein